MEAAAVDPHRIRAARAEDRADILLLAGLSGLFDADALDEVASMLDAFLNGSAAADRWVVDPVEGPGRLGGVAYCAPERMTDGVWNLLMLTVRPDRRGTGRGAALVRHVEDELCAAGARMLLIETSGAPGFDGQRAFYAGLGYRLDARITDYYEPGDAKVVFSKQLGPPPVVPGPLRTASPADLTAVLELAEAFYAEDGFTTTRASLLANLRHLVASPAARVAVVELDQTLVAFAITTTSFGLENGLIAELEDLYVTPDRRRQGIARQLLDNACAWAREQGAAHVEIVIAPNGRNVRHLDAFYAARGFVDDGRRLLARPLS